MSEQNFLSGMLIEETTTYTFIEVCHRYHIPEELLIEMIEHGLFPNQPTDPQKITMDQKELRRIESAFRLHRDLEINLPGVALALELLEKIEHMERELDILRKHF
ncbi:chaperone modulator CbpM [Legionella worsleiensis]|uniref:Putative chaperone-modulator protein CbpM n=1 Tax=Legionella worsleiensis TaxID=45076 RepID=A0A0W1AL92_9GAMM|nr:chaperone modulator CbpM [Legionella worsleiensis]KTD81960.1 putative chaperone-modulator protein CbpM [Legionella worsleiensis]STY31332.1 putative chaperone-modulator protein CbpM [Legionella worsleiensis]